MSLKFPIGLAGKRASGYTDDAGTYALSFDGDTDSVDCGSDASLTDVFASGGTIVARIKVASDGENDAGRVFCSREFGGGSGLGHMLFTTNEAAGFCKLDFYRDYSTTDGRWQTDSADLELGVWKTVAVTYTDGTSNDAKIYIDGVEVATSETSTPAGSAQSDTDNKFFIGAENLNLREFDGDIDWVRIYDKELSEAELQDIAAMSGNLVEAWEFEENTGTTASAEVSSPTNDGTINNATWTTV